MELSDHVRKRIIEVRTIARVNQSELARRMGVSSSLISMWEAGERNPSSDQLFELSRHLGVPLDYLFKEKVQPVFQFRANAPVQVPQRSAINHLSMQASAQIEYIDEIFRAAAQPIPTCMHWSEFSFPHVPQLATHARDILRLNRRVTLAELKQAMAEQGIFVFEWNMPPEVSGMSYRGPITAVFINHLHQPTRRLFTLAHELAHILFHLGRTKEETASISISSFVDPIEKEANTFASELLMPLADVQAVVDRYHDEIRNPALMETIARTFNVSRDAFFYRLTELEICSWNEKTRFASPYENHDPGTHPVTEIAAQVPALFLEPAIALHLRKQNDPAQLADWLATAGSAAKAYLSDLVRVHERTFREEI